MVGRILGDAKAIVLGLWRIVDVGHGDRDCGGIGAAVAVVNGVGEGLNTDEVTKRGVLDEVVGRVARRTVVVDAGRAAVVGGADGGDAQAVAIRIAVSSAAVIGLDVQGGGDRVLGNGDRVSKTDPRIQAYGATDELNSVLGLARTTPLADEVGDWLASVQNDLFDLGADLCVPAGTGKAERPPLRVLPEQVSQLEAWIDKKKMVSEEVESSRLSTRIEVDPSKPLGVCCFDTQAAFRNIQIRTETKPDMELAK